MSTVSVRVPDELKQRMEEHNEINWSAIIRYHIEEALAEMESRNIARAVATSERLSQEIDVDEVREKNTAEVIRRFRDTRYSKESE